MEAAVWRLMLRLQANNSRTFSVVGWRCLKVYGIASVGLGWHILIFMCVCVRFNLCVLLMVDFGVRARFMLSLIPWVALLPSLKLSCGSLTDLCELYCKDSAMSLHFLLSGLSPAHVPGLPLLLYQAFFRFAFWQAVVVTCGRDRGRTEFCFGRNKFAL